MLTKKLIYNIITGRVTWEEFQALELNKDERKLLYDAILVAYNNIDIYDYKSMFPKTGHIKKLYIDLSTNKAYIWKNANYYSITGEVVDNLNSYDVNSSLSANQGRVLKSIIDEFKHNSALLYNSIIDKITKIHTRLNNIEQDIIEATDEEVNNILNN